MMVKASDINVEALETAFLAAHELNCRECRRGEIKNFIEWQWGPRKDYRGVVLDDFQWDFLRHVFDRAYTQVFIKGCTKPGKGFAASMAVNMWFDVYPESKIILTGPSVDHVKDNLFAEIVSLRKQMRMPGPGEIQTEDIRVKGTKHYVVIANPKTGEGFSGQHSSHTLFLFDEASSAADWMFDHSLKQARMILALSNPRTLSGWFRRGFGDSRPDETHSEQTPRGKRRCITVGGEDCRNVREKRLESQFAPKGGIKIKRKELDEGEFIPDELYQHVKPIIPSQLDYARYLEIMSHPDEFHRDVFGRGRFPKEDAELQVIVSSWLSRHVEAWRKVDGLYRVAAFGLDVAASEFGDETVLAAGGPEGCRCLFERQHANAMEQVGWVLDKAASLDLDLKDGTVPVAVDYGGGYGRGVGDRLREVGVAVIAVQPSKRSSMPNNYENVRTELYGELSQRLNPNGPWSEVPWGIPDDGMLHDDLCAQEKIRSSDGVRYRLIPKEKPNKAYTGPTVEGKIGRSPDRGDAVSLLYYAVKRMELRMDVSDRSLVIDVAEPKDEPKIEETPSERYERERDEEIQRMCAAMDAEGDAFSGIG